MPAVGWGEVLAALRDRPSESDSERLMAEALMLADDVADATVGCSVTELAGAEYRTPAASNDLAWVLDQAQYAVSDGPCVSAARDRAPQQIDVLAAERRFPGFVAVALDQGVRSSLSVPVNGTDHPMALNLYAAVESAYASDRARSVAHLLSRVIGAVAGSAPIGVTPAAFELAQARKRGEHVGDALDRLMRRHDLDRSAAFAALVERSCARQLSVSAIAEDLLNEGPGGDVEDDLDGEVGG